MTVDVIGDHTITYYAVDVVGNVEVQATDEFEVADTSDGLPRTGGTFSMIVLVMMSLAGLGLSLRFAGKRGVEAA